LNLPTPTLSACAAAAARVLVAAGFPPDDSRRDATLLARWRLGWTVAEWLTRQHEPAPPEFARQLDQLIQRRADREPVAYITGSREFYGRRLRVTSAVLVPRPETEFVVEEALTALATIDPPGANREPLIADVGTGSGCLAITLALEWPSAHVLATDISEEALELARENAAVLGALDRIEFWHGSLVPPGIPPLALIVSNPPYIPEGDRRSLPLEVRGFEPATALFAGVDGLEVIRELLPSAESALASSGWLIFEIGIDQSKAVRRLIQSRRHLSLVKMRRDYQGIPRVVVCRKTA